MERKSALAVAAAITMSVVSGLFAIGASTGTLQPGSSVAAPAPAVQVASAAPSTPHGDDPAAKTPSTSAPSGVTHTNTARGESDD